MARKILVLPNGKRVVLDKQPGKPPTVTPFGKNTIKQSPVKVDKYGMPVQSARGRGFTMKRLLAATARHFPNRFLYLKKTGVSVYKFSRITKDAFRVVTTETKHPLESPLHRQVILRLERDKPFTRSRLAMKCDCSDFKFTFSYVLHRNGAMLAPLDALEKSPDIRNPGHQPSVCKHLIACFQKLAMMKEPL